MHFVLKGLLFNEILNKSGGIEREKFLCLVINEIDINDERLDIK